MSAFECPDCGFSYIKESPHDRKIHRTHHNEVVNGISLRPVKSERVIWRDNEDRITVVTPFSPRAQRVRARKVARLANLEMRYDFGIYHEDELPDERNLHLFIYCRGSRAVGFLMLEKREHIWRYTWEEYSRGDRKDPERKEPLWSLSLVWVHRKHRRMGIARTLFNEALRFLGIDLGTLGVYTPFSDDGEKFARALFPREFLIVK